MSRRLLDFLACCTDPAALPCVARDHERLDLARRAAYEQPWSHAVLRALELAGAPRTDQFPGSSIVSARRRKTSSPPSICSKPTGQVQRRGRSRSLKQIISVNTSHDPERALALKVSWTETAPRALAAPGAR